MSRGIMRIVTISNLFPRPDQPSRGVFNLQLFGAMADIVLRDGGSLETIVPVAEWRIGCHAAIERWRPPAGVPDSVNVHYRPYYYLPLAGRSASVAFLQHALKAEAEAMARADIVFATWLYPDCVAVANWMCGRGKTVGILVQGSDTIHLRSAIRRRQIMRALDRDVRVYCVSNGLADRLEDAGVRTDKIKVTPNGVDGALFHYRSKDEARMVLASSSSQTATNINLFGADSTLPVRSGSSTGRSTGVGSPRLQSGLRATSVLEPGAAEYFSRLVLFVGNLVPVKGCDRLIRSFARYLDASKVQNTRLIIIGDGPMRPELEAMAKKAGSADYVIFLGRRPYAEIPFWMNVADMLCLPSRNEGHPNVVSEALASGLPVIAADVGACRDLLHNEQDAMVIPDNDAFIERLATALAVFGQRAVDRIALAQRHSHRTWHAMAGEILSTLGKKSE